jgi:3-oxoacid CoA-transferase subunit B
VISDLGVLDITERGFVLVECAPDVTLEQLRAATGAPVHAD